MDYESVKAELVRWAVTEDNIRAILITGSTARGLGDALSDLDIELYVRNPEPLLTDTEWYETLGDVLVVEALPNPGWIPTRLVYYVGGKLDFGIADATFLTASHHTRPIEVLVDKDGATKALSIDVAHEVNLCSEEDFFEVLNWFWAGALMCAKAVSRNEPWMAITRSWEANQNLLRMIEWDHKARYGLSYETWFLGKHLQRWADPEVFAEVERCFARFDTDAIAEALNASMDLFERLAVRTGQAIAAPSFNHGKVRAEVHTILHKCRPS
jgi:aminoglycoside 6-adenylyltransferase